MITARSAGELTDSLDALRGSTPPSEGQSVAFVPTMGALHDGHLELVRRARASGAITVASVFVNPRQFKAGEDFEIYPRDSEGDSGLLEAEGCDVLFLPSEADVYPDGFASTVLADRSLTGCLCGSTRGSSHFDGVATVVARLFGLVMPTTAWFGEKDWQQLLVIRRLAADLYPSISIVGVPTVRETDGLAMSSRNLRLDGTGRRAASAIPVAIRGIQEWASSEVEGAPLGPALRQVRDQLTEAGLDVEYVEVRNAATLAAIEALRHGAADRVFVAASSGATRLIDNSSLLPDTAKASQSPTPVMTSALTADD